MERAIDAERRKLKLFAVGDAAGLMLFVSLVVFLIPAAVLYPLAVMHGFLTSMTGVLACVALLAVQMRCSQA